MQTARMMMMLFTEHSLRVSSGLGALEVFVMGKLTTAPQDRHLVCSPAVQGSRSGGQWELLKPHCSLHILLVKAASVHLPSLGSR